jgi:hypothetical protein
MATAQDVNRETGIGRRERLLQRILHGIGLLRVRRREAEIVVYPGFEPKE